MQNTTSPVVWDTEKMESLLTRLKQQELLKNSVEALNQYTNDSDSLWTSLSALIQGHRELLKEVDRLAGLTDTQRLELKDLTEQKIQLAEEIEFLQNTDGLTGVSNYRRFREVLDQEWQRAMRSQSPLSLIMIDIDFFRNYNDSYGHVAGDLCLKRVSALLAEVFKRPSDLVAHYGGAELVCVAPDTDHEGALAVADRVLTGVQDLDIPHASSRVSEVVTISLGAATTIPTKAVKPFELAAAAEALVQSAKDAGRNQMQASELAQHPGDD